jgi:hypothetical protein
LKDQLAVIQKYISQFTYDFEGSYGAARVEQINGVKQPRLPYLKMVVKVAKDVIRDAKPIRCPEAVYLGCIHHPHLP